MYRLGVRQLALVQQQQDFVAAVSHELKTPLTAIRMYAEMLREGWTPEEKRPAYYAFIHDESERLARLIHNVLSLARMTRQALQVTPARVTVAEQAQAKHAIARLRLHRTEVMTRRWQRSGHGPAIDMRRTLKGSMRAGGHFIDLERREKQWHQPPLVVLCDISGSCSNYSRMFLHFLHALTNDRDRVSVFLFGTRLTNVTRELARRDIDEAMAKVSGAVKDWSGGTRIGTSLKEFNYKWARRVLTQGAHVLIMTDGLDREGVDTLEHEMQRLRRQTKRIIWLNPLLRFDGFKAMAGGVRAMMPHVDEFRPVHSLDSLRDLATALAGPPAAEHDPRIWLRRG